MSLRLRVVFAIALVLLTSALLGTALAGWLANQALHEELVAAMVGARQTAAGAFETLPRSDHPARDLTRLVRAFDGERHLVASLTDGDGRLVAVSRPLAGRSAPAWFAALFHPDLAPMHLPVPAWDYSALTLTPVFANDVAAIWAEFTALIGVLSVSFLFGSALIWFTVGRALHPLADFSAAFLRIGSGDYAAKVREEGPLELRRLGRGVNEMARRLGAMQAKTHALEGQLRTLQDEERADLARDLHDEIGPHLFAVNVDAAMARRLIGEGQTAEALRQVEAIQDAVGHMQRLVRDILGRLRPTELIELGLAAAIAELVAFWRARHPAIRFEVTAPSDEAPMPDQVRETLYRVVQESLNNAVRHGRPGRIDIEVAKLASGEFIARVTDDGAPAERRGEAGFGLIGMRERVAAARGQLSITMASQGGGWTVLARLPGREAADEIAEDAA